MSNLFIREGSTCNTHERKRVWFREENKCWYSELDTDGFKCQWNTGKV